MNKLKMLQRIKQLYEKDDVNIIDYLKNLDSNTLNSVEDIMISYDFQAGTYTKRYFSDSTMRAWRDRLTVRIAETIDSLPCGHQSIFEAGVGEATGFAPLMMCLKKTFVFGGGADISWSRIKYAKRFVRKICSESFPCEYLVMGDLFSLPLQDNSVNVLYTCSSLEPNGGSEKILLQECYRVAAEYVVLVEPGYEFADEEHRARMRRYGYVTNLYQSAKELGYDVVSYDPWESFGDPRNPLACMIIHKKKTHEGREMPLGDPLTHTPLKRYRECYYSEKAQLLYPIVDDIACLIPQQAIVATKFME